jgi:hypothetical protein
VVTEAGAGERTWRLPVGWRMLGITCEALLLLFVPGIIMLTDSSSPGPVSWVVLATLILASVLLAWRLWLESVTLTADALVIRNVFTTRRVPLTDIVGVTIDRNRLRVAQANGAGGAYLTGRRAEVDEIAEIIADAAGLPPLPPRRKQVLSRRQVRSLLVAGVVCMGLGFAFGPLQGAGTGLPHAVTWVGVILWPLGATILVPAAWAIIDYRRTPKDPRGPAVPAQR